jgi:hypothetical protein
VTVAGKEVLVAQGHELLGVKRDDNGTPVAVDAHGEGGGEAAPGISLPLGQEDL